MSISVAAIQTAFIAYQAKVVLANTARTNIVNAGARPTFPEIAVVNNDYNNVLTAQGVWDANNATLSALLITAINKQRQFEQDVIAIMPPNQWVKVVNVSPFWIGVTSNSNIQNQVLVIKTVEPTEDFPNF